MWLGQDGRPQPGRGIELWINARMTYVFALNALLGEGADLPLAEHGVRSLTALLADPVHGGWFDEVGLDGSVPGTRKACYGHAHVVMASAVASAAGAAGAQELFETACAVHESRFWDPSVGACREELSRDWSIVDPYRGANSNMHTVEACLFAADVSGDTVWLERALSIARRLIDVNARAHGWRLPEHYDAEWTPQPDYHRDRPADPFRPFGATPGHAFEWSRLLLQLASSLPDAPSWVSEASAALFRQAALDATEDGRAGLVYTTDWSGTPIVRERFHWVMCEAVLAAEAWHAHAGLDEHAALARRWWDEIDRHVVDRSTGAWRHELDPDMRESTRTWVGRPDAYHAFNALTLPDLPLAPSPAATASRAR